MVEIYAGGDSAGGIFVTQCNNPASRKASIPNRCAATRRRYNWLLKWHIPKARRRAEKKAAAHRIEMMNSNLLRNLIMKRMYIVAAGIVASLGLGLTVPAHAHQGSMGEGMGHGAQGGGMGHGGMMHGKSDGMGHGGMMHGKSGGMGHGGMMQGMSGGTGHADMGHGAMGGGMGQGRMGGQSAGQQLMTPEEQTALREKMRNAATQEERQKLAEANRTEMQKRAKEKGITLPEGRGPRGGAGPNSETHKH